MLSMQMFGRDENTPNVKRQKNQTISCFCRSLQATEYVHWIQKDWLCDGVVECSMFFVVWGLVKLKAVIKVLFSWDTKIIHECRWQKT